jgi:NitT/TauT family transport system substrate-binding protein
MRSKDCRRARFTGPRAAAAILALTATLAACGNEDDTGAAAAGDGVTKVTVAVLPFIDVAPVYLGVKQGFFKDAGLDVDVATAQGGAATVTGVVSGDYQFAFTGWLPLMQARQSKVPVHAIANAQYQTPPDKHEGAERTNQDVLVPGNSPIKTPADLTGATIAVNALKGVQETLLRNTLEQNGVAQNSVKLVELPFPDMPAALQSGQVDAAFVGEPFETGVLDAGGRIVATPYADTTYAANLSCFITSDKYQAEHGDQVKAFAEAMNRSLTYAQENPDEARAIVTTYTKITPELVQRVQLPYWGPGASKDSLREQAEMGLKFGALKEMPDIDELTSTVIG